MWGKFRAWLEITGVALFALGLFIALGLTSYLVIRVIWVGLTLTNMTFINR